MTVPTDQYLEAEWLLLTLVTVPTDQYLEAEWLLLTLVTVPTDQYLEAERPADGYYMEHDIVDWTLQQLFSYNFSHPTALAAAVKRLYLGDVDYSRSAELIPRLTEVSMASQGEKWAG